MIKTVGLMVAHGSPQQIAVDQTLELHRQFEVGCVYPCGLGFLEFAEPSLDEGLRWAAGLSGERGRVVVLPLFLGAAGHLKKDIPASISQARRLYPEVEYICAAPLAPHADLLTLMDMRIREALADTRQARPAEESSVLVVGRGSSDPDSNSEIARAARLLFEQHRFAGVEYAFQAVARPNVAEGIAKAAALGARQVIVALDILFEGFVEQNIRNIARQEGQKLGLPVVVTAPLGVHPLLLQVLEQRFSEALTGRMGMPCDTCVYRPAASAHALPPGEPLS